MSQVGGDVGGKNSCAGNCSCSFSGPVKLQDPGSSFAQPEIIEKTSRCTMALSWFLTIRFLQNIFLPGVPAPVLT